MNLTPNERKTFYLHLAYALLNGVIQGVLALNEFVFIKSLHGSNFQLGFLFQFSVVVFAFLFILNEFLKRIVNKKKLLKVVGIISHLPMAFLVFFPHAYPTPIYNYLFLLIFLIYYMGWPVTLPLINLFLKNSYSHAHFSTLFSYATSVSKVTMLVVTFGYGLLLDLDNYVFTWIFPVVSLLGIGAIYLFTRIEYRQPPPPPEILTRGIKASIRQSVANMVDILRSNSAYRHFEIGFMLYGIAFMISITVITILFDELLHLNYASVAFYKNGYNVVAILLLPLCGRLLGRVDPRIFAGITYLAMFFYIVSITLTEFFPFNFEIWGIQVYYMLVSYMLFNGMFVAGMALLWTIGSAYFCRDEDTAEYQSLHLSLVGVRALFAPLAGVWLYQMIGFAGTFSIAAGLLVMAMGVMVWSYKKF
ncbi:MFS transporter [Desulfocicer niacini]